MRNILILLVVVFISSCKQTSKWTDEDKKSFINGCVQESSDKNYCLCIFNKVEKKYTVEELELEFQKIKEGQSSSFITKMDEWKIKCNSK